MTNLQQGAGGISGALLRRVWLGLPIAAGGLLALLLTAFALLPQWLGLQRDMNRQAELEATRSELAVLRAQINSSESSREKAEAQQAKLFELVTGNGDLSTFMAMVDREAQLAGVQLDLFEPQLAGAAAAAGVGAKPGLAAGAQAAAAAAAGSAAAAPGKAGGSQANTAAAAVEIAGLKSQSILLSARGRYPNLLDFLRRLENLNVLVAQSDLRLLLEEAKPAKGVARTDTVVLKVLLSLYGRQTSAVAGPAPAPPPAGAAPNPPAAATPTAPPNAPAPAPSR